MVLWWAQWASGTIRCTVPIKFTPNREPSSDGTRSGVQAIALSYDDEQECGWVDPERVIEQQGRRTGSGD